MAKLVFKLIVTALALYGTVTLGQNLTPLFKKTVTNPVVSRSPAVKSAVDTANQILPEEQQLSLPQSDSGDTQDVVSKTITQIITQKVAETAASTTDNLKDSAHDQVCREILTKVIDQCGAPD